MGFQKKVMPAIENFQSSEEVGICTKEIRKTVVCPGQREEYSDAEAGQRTANNFCQGG